MTVQMCVFGIGAYARRWAAAVTAEAAAALAGGYGHYMWELSLLRILVGGTREGFGAPVSGLYKHEGNHQQ